MPANKAWRDAGSYEYIPSTFTPLTLPYKLATIRAALFGTAPDNYFLNFRVRELLRYIHETELAPYLYALDPRVTYWPEHRNADFSAPKQLKITQTAGQPRRIAVVGQFDVNNASGRAARQYTVTLAPGTATIFTATVAELNTPAAETITTPFDSLSTAPTLDVPQTSLKLRFSNTALTASAECNIITEFGDMLLVEDYDVTTDAYGVSCASIFAVSLAVGCSCSAAGGNHNHNANARNAWRDYFFRVVWRV